MKSTKVSAMALAAIALGGGLLPAQEFEVRIVAPDSILLNSTFEVAFTLTSRNLPAGGEGARGWTLGVSHQGLEIVEATTASTVVEELLRGGFENTQLTYSSPERPQNDGFVSAVILSFMNATTLPTSGTVTIARATYRAGPEACTGARIAVTDGLEGSGTPIKNVVTWQITSYHAGKAERTYPGCSPNDYVLRIDGPGSVDIPVGERRRLSTSVRLAQAVPTAHGWTLAVAHDPELFQIVGVSLDGSGIEGLLDPGGFALFEVTSGAGNSGFTAQAEFPPGPWRALPAPEAIVAVAEYELVAPADPAWVGWVLQGAFEFAGSLRGSGGPVTNTVIPDGNLVLHPLAIGVRVIPATAFIRGDANGDGAVDLADSLAVLFHLFEGGAEVCLEAANGNDDALVDLSDAVHILEHLFRSGPSIPPPWPDCGTDPGLASLGCDRSSCP
jgi:hypothetical protein